MDNFISVPVNMYNTKIIKNQKYSVKMEKSFFLPLSGEGVFIRAFLHISSR